MSRAAGTLAKSYAHAHMRPKIRLMRLAGISPKTTLYLMAQKYFMNACITTRIHTLVHDMRWPLVIPRWGRPNCAGLSSTATYDACTRRGLHSSAMQRHEYHTLVQCKDMSIKQCRVGTACSIVGRHRAASNKHDDANDWGHYVGKTVLVRLSRPMVVCIGVVCVGV